MLTPQELTNRRSTRELSIATMLALLLSACAPAASTVSRSPNSQLILELQRAKELDQSYAVDPQVGPVASGDFSVQADKAATAIDEIEHGVEVPQSQINDALFVPPKSISPEQRIQLIRQLQVVRQLDNQGWWDWTRDPVIAQDFAVQEKKVDRVTRELQTGQAVSWLAINEALHVPQYP